MGSENGYLEKNYLIVTCWFIPLGHFHIQVHLGEPYFRIQHSYRHLGEKSMHILRDGSLNHSHKSHLWYKFYCFSYTRKKNFSNFTKNVVFVLWHLKRQKYLLYDIQEKHSSGEKPRVTKQRRGVRGGMMRDNRMWQTVGARNDTQAGMQIPLIFLIS